MKIKISKNNNIITTVEEWYQFAPPKAKGKHWKDGRSAKSLAQFMTDKNQVKKLEDILVELEYDTNGVISCTPEANTVLPCKGNGRNHDGKVGTSKRDAMEKQLKEEVNAYFVGDTIRKMRQAQNLTQEELGDRVGVQKAQISRLEKGKSVITLPTMSRVFQALGVSTATLDLGIGGKVALW